MIRNAGHRQLFTKVIRTPSFLARGNYFTAIAMLLFTGHGEVISTNASHGLSDAKLFDIAWTGCKEIAPRRDF